MTCVGALQRLRFKLVLTPQQSVPFDSYLGPTTERVHQAHVRTALLQLLGAPLASETFWEDVEEACTM